MGERRVTAELATIVVAGRWIGLPGEERVGAAFVACAASAREVAEVVREASPDWLLLPSGEDEAGSLLLLAAARTVKPSLRFAVLLESSNADLTDRWFHRGAEVILEQNSTPGRLMHSLVAAKELSAVIVDSSVQQEVLRQQVVLAPHLVAGGQQITPVELRVLRLIVAGLSSKEAAAKLSMSLRTLESHLTAPLPEARRYSPY